MSWLLQEEQEKIVNTSYNKILLNGGGVISVPCGAGKTVMVLDLICKLGLKALIIVPKSCLIKQTIEKIEQFTTAKVGIIRQKKVVVDNVDIVVGMIHSIALKDYDESIFKDFGTVVYDECHRSPSRIFSNSFKKVGANYTIGLSATPRRKDGLIRVMFWNLGSIVYRNDKKKNMKVFVHVINYDSNDKNYVEKKQYIKRQLKPSTVRTMTELIKIDNRNKIINEITINIILENVNGKINKNSYRKILVLSERIEHLKTLKQLFDNTVKKLIIHNKIESIDAFTSGLYIGGMKQSELDYSAQSDIIYGSYALAKEGLDISDLNVLIMATPQKDIEQAVGRILRKQMPSDDIFPLVIDIRDSLYIFSKWYPEREKLYVKQEYVIQDHEIFEQELVTPKKKLLLDKKISEDEYNNMTDHQVRKVYLINRYGEYHYTTLDEEKLLNYPISDYTSNKTFENMFDIDYAKYGICKEANITVCDENDNIIECGEEDDYSESGEEDEYSESCEEDNINESDDKEECINVICGNTQTKTITNKITGHIDHKAEYKDEVTLDNKMKFNDKKLNNEINSEDLENDIFARAKKLKLLKMSCKND